MSHLLDWGRSENPAAPEVVSQPHSTPSRPLLRKGQEKVLLGNLLPPPHSLVLPSCPERRGEPVELAWGAEDVLLFTVVERLQWCRTPLIPAFKRKRQADL